MSFPSKALARALGVLLLLVLAAGCIRSPTYPTPDEGDEGADGPDTGGPSALVPHPGSPVDLPAVHFA